MAQCVVVHYPGLAAADADSITKQIAPAGFPGAVSSQIVGTSADGVTVITLWDGPGREQFFKEHVKPALDKLAAEASVSVLDVHRVYRRT